MGVVIDIFEDLGFDAQDRLIAWQKMRAKPSEQRREIIRQLKVVRDGGGALSKVQRAGLTYPVDTA